MKAIRKARYKRIMDLKKSWFGYLANKELNLDIEYNATLIWEDLTVMATEKDKPYSQACLFNKMINKGLKSKKEVAALPSTLSFPDLKDRVCRAFRSKGIYLRQAGGKLL